MVDEVTAAVMRPFNMAAWLSQGMDYLGKFTHTDSYEKVSWVYAAASKTADTISQIPIIFKGKNTGEPIPDQHPVSILFNPPSGFLIPSMSSLIKTSMLQRELFGESFWAFRSDGTVEPIFGGFMQPVFIPGSRDVAGWRFDDGRKREFFRLEDILFYKYPHPIDPLRGMPPLTAARWAIEQDINMTAWNAANFKNGVRPKIVVTAKQGITPKQRQDIREEVKKNNAGLPGEEIMIIGGNVEVETVTQNLRDLEFANGREMTREEILAVMDVPPSLVGVYRFANYANARFQGQQFYFNKVLPITSELEEIVTQQLEMLGFSDVQMEFDHSDIIDQFMPIKDRADAAKVLVDMGVPLEAALDASKIELNDALMNPQPPSGEGGRPDSQNPPELPSTPSTPSEPFLSADKVDDLSVLRLSSYAWDLLEARAIRPIKKFTDIYLNDLLRDVKNDPEFFHVDVGMWRRILEQTLEPVTSKIIFAGWNVVDAEITGKAAMLEIAKAPIDTLFDQPSIDDFDVDALGATVSELTRSFSGAAGTIATDVERRVSRGLAEGLSLKEIENSLSDLFDSPRWSRVISRQVVGGTYNTGRFLGMLNKGIAQHRWQSMRDGNERPTHSLEHGNVQTIGMPFPVTGLRYPHDPLGRSSEIYGCRCISVPVTKRTGKSKRLERVFAKREIVGSFFETLKQAFDGHRVPGWKSIKNVDQAMAVKAGNELGDYFRNVFVPNNKVTSELGENLLGLVEASGVNKDKVIENVSSLLGRMTPLTREIKIEINPSLGFRSSGNTIFIPKSVADDFVRVFEKGQFDPFNDIQNISGSMYFQLGVILERENRKIMKQFLNKRIDRKAPLSPVRATGDPNAKLPFKVFDSNMPHPLMGADLKDESTLITPFIYMIMGNSIHGEFQEQRTLGEWFLSDPPSFDKVIDTLWEDEE